MTLKRDIGPVGTAARVVGALVAIGLPIALSGFGWWEAGMAFVALPLVATASAELVTAAHRRVAPDAPARRDAICSGPACWLVAILMGAAIAVDVLTPVNGDVALWVWLGSSMLVAAARGYGGCEVLAVPNLVTGRGDQIGCLLYTPIDRAEARRAYRRGEALSALR
jgi:hypothetical protein